VAKDKTKKELEKVVRALKKKVKIIGESAKKDGANAQSALGDLIGKNQALEIETWHANSNRDLLERKVQKGDRSVVLLSSTIVAIVDKSTGYDEMSIMIIDSGEYGHKGDVIARISIDTVKRSIRSLDKESS